MKKMKLASLAMLVGASLSIGVAAQAVTQASTDFINLAKSHASAQTSIKNYNAAQMFCDLIMTQPLDDPDPMLLFTRVVEYNNCSVGVEEARKNGSAWHIG